MKVNIQPPARPPQFDDEATNDYVIGVYAWCAELSRTLNHALANIDDDNITSLSYEKLINAPEQKELTIEN